MKYIIILLISIFTFTSCMTEQKCARKYPPKVIVKDCTVYVTNTVYKDSIINHYVAGDTVYTVKDSLVNVYINAETGLINSDTSSLNSQFVTAYAWVSNSNLEQMIIQHDSVYQFKLDSAIRVTTEELEKYHSETTIAKVFVTRWYDKIARVIALLFLSAVLILFATKIIKAYIKPF